MRVYRLGRSRPAQPSSIALEVADARQTKTGCRHPVIFDLVGLNGLEPSTLRLSSARSNQLS